jgi:nickel-dependent lactate racemase
MTKSIKLPQFAWHGAKEVEFEIPDGWQVEIGNMEGHDSPRLSPAQIKQAIGSPIAMAPLREYARGKKEAVIIIDDMTRVTRASDMVPHVLEELAAAGIEDRHIRFISACGCHGAMNRMDFEKKLGRDVLKRFPVFNHAPYDNCVYAGTTSRGTRISINAEVMKCDLKIGIGSIVPHIMAGFGGGSKLILPGVSAHETILALHAPDESGVSGTVTGMGIIENNPRRQDIDEAAAIVGLDMKVDALVNRMGETVAVFAGEPGEAFRAGLESAKKHYLTPALRDKDIVIANTYAKVNEAISGLLIAFPSLKKEGGDVVLMANAPEGQITHYLMGPFGNSIGGQYSLQMKPPPHVGRLIVYSEYPEVANRRYLEDSERVVLAYEWDEVLRILSERHGPGAKVGVYPDSDIQYCIT